MKCCKWNFIENFYLKATLKLSLQFSVKLHTPAKTEDLAQKKEMLNYFESVKEFETCKKKYVKNWKKE